MSSLGMFGNVRVSNEMAEYLLVVMGSEEAEMIDSLVDTCKELGGEDLDHKTRPRLRYQLKTLHEIQDLVEQLEDITKEEEAPNDKAIQLSNELYSERSTVSALRIDKVNLEDRIRELEDENDGANLYVASYIPAEALHMRLSAAGEVHARQVRARMELGAAFVGPRWCPFISHDAYMLGLQA